MFSPERVLPPPPPTLEALITCIGHGGGGIPLSFYLKCFLRGVPSWRSNDDVLVVGPAKNWRGFPPFIGFGVYIYFNWSHGTGTGVSCVPCTIFNRFTGVFVSDCVSFQRGGEHWTEVSSFTCTVIRRFSGGFNSGRVMYGLTWRGDIIGVFLAKNLQGVPPFVDVVCIFFA